MFFLPPEKSHAAALAVSCPLSGFGSGKVKVTVFARADGWPLTAFSFEQDNCNRWR
jgi:hypothetical protein